MINLVNKINNFSSVYDLNSFDIVFDNTQAKIADEFTYTPNNTHINKIPAKYKKERELKTLINYNKEDKEVIFEELEFELYRAVNPKFTKNDYRNLFTTKKNEKEIEIITSIIEDNYSLDDSIYSSFYSVDNEKWETSENKACNIILPKNKLNLKAVVLGSPFIRLNSANKISTMTIDIDFDEFKENNAGMQVISEKILSFFKDLKETSSEIYIPNIATFTKKGLQLTYLLDNTFFTNKRKQIAKIMKAKSLIKENKYDINTKFYHILDNDEVENRETKEKKLTKFFTATFNKLQKVLIELFNADNFAIQTNSQGRVVRNPIVNPSVFLSTDKKSFFELVDNKRLNNLIIDFLPLNLKYDNIFNIDTQKASYMASKLIENPFLNYNKELETYLKNNDSKIIKTTPILLNKAKKKKNLVGLELINREKFTQETFSRFCYDKDSNYLEYYKFNSDYEKKVVTSAIATTQKGAINFELTKGTGYRNELIFYAVRHYAYTIKAEDKYRYSKITTYANFINRNLENPILESELKATIDSIYNFNYQYREANQDIKNKLLAKKKSIKTKLTLVKKIISTGLTIKAIRNLSYKQLSELLNHSMTTLKRYGKDILIALYKGYFATIKKHLSKFMETYIKDLDKVLDIATIKQTYIDYSSLLGFNREKANKIKRNIENYFTSKIVVDKLKEVKDTIQIFLNKGVLNGINNMFNDLIKDVTNSLRLTNIQKNLNFILKEEKFIA